MTPPVDHRQPGEGGVRLCIPRVPAVFTYEELHPDFRGVEKDVEIERAGYDSRPVNALCLVHAAPNRALPSQALPRPKAGAESTIRQRRDAVQHGPLISGCSRLQLVRPHWVVNRTSASPEQILPMENHPLRQPSSCSRRR